MATTKNKKEKSTIYSPSVNIIRDDIKSLNYIPTPNTQQVYEQLIRDYKQGIRSFNLIGAYGTGKSSFLWALKQTLSKELNYFFSKNDELELLNKFEFYPIIGEYASMIKTFSTHFNINVNNEIQTNEIISHIDKYYNKLNKKRNGLAIVIDEFGKFLEFAAQNCPEKELYFIQQLAEYANDVSKNILFITTLHQNFNAYALDLTKAQQHEWDKVKGRLKELTFNEPVEQLLYLASERLDQKKQQKHKSINIHKSQKGKKLSELLNAIKDANAFPLKDYFKKDIAVKLLPFDILSASVLTIALQRYGQNERSLFSFIESNDYYGLMDFDTQKDPFYNISNVYDYLLHNYHSLLTTKYNPHYSQWSAIRSAIERAEALFEDNVYDATKIVKTIGLLNIFASDSAKIDKDFLSKYSKYCLGIKNPGQIIEKLESNKIILFKKYLHKYNIFEGTDLDIELAIDEAGKLVEQVSDIVHHLNEYFQFPYIPAKSVYYQKGTPRFFQFILSDNPINQIPEGEIDGFINLIFSETVNAEGVLKHSKKADEAILYGYYNNTSKIKSLIHEIEKAKKVREQNFDDKIAKRELDSIIQHQINLLNHYVLGSLYDNNSSISWYFQGKELSITDQKSFNQQLSIICDIIYNKTPQFKSELVNKTKVSGAVSTARKNLLNKLIENWAVENLDFDEHRFPPEKTIYLSLLYSTGIHRKIDEGYTLDSPNEKSFSALWKTCHDFLDSTKSNKRSLSELTDILLSKPFKLKQGFLDFWLPIFLIIKQDDYALFGQDGYIPYINTGTLELIIKKPKDFTIKAFDVEGVRLDLFNMYRKLLEQKQEQKPSSNSFIETIKPFITFYRDLPTYAKNTKRLSKEALALREAIVKSQDPEKTFFEDFPNALGYSIVQLSKDEKQLENYIEKLRHGIREIRTCYDELINRFEQFLLNNIVGENIYFSNYQEKLQKRFNKLRTHLLLPEQKVFFQRVMSPIDDRESWLNSIGQAALGKPLEQITDEEENKLYQNIHEKIYELDNLSELSEADIDFDKEEVYKLELTDFIKGLQKSVIRMPKRKQEKISMLENEIKSKLSHDKQQNILILVKLLQEQMDKNE